MPSFIILSVKMLSITFIYCYAGCRYAECHIFKVGAYLNSLPANVRLGCKCLSVTNKTFNADILSPIIRCCSSLAIIKYSLQGILMGEVSLYY